MVTIVSFIGRSESGKTTLLETVIGELKSMGYRVGVIKHTPHGFDVDSNGKDTGRFSKAGADIVAAASSSGMAYFEKVQEEPDLDKLRRLFEGKVDIILTEGYKTSNTAKILVVRDGNDMPQVKYNGKLLAKVSSSLSSGNVAVFYPQDISQVVNMLVQQLRENQAPLLKLLGSNVL